MLNEKRIKEAETNFKVYLADGLIKQENLRKEVFDTYMRNYKESLNLPIFIDKNEISFFIMKKCYYKTLTLPVQFFYNFLDDLQIILLTLTHTFSTLPH